MDAKLEMRHVYLDLGANWADTIGGYAHIVAHDERMTGVRGAKNWEVYSFEASPFLMPFVDAKVRWLNGASADRPVACVPPVGSSADLEYFWHDVVNPFNRNATCHRLNSKIAYNCMMVAFGHAYRDLIRRANSTLLSAAVVDARLAEASVPQPLDATRVRYTFVPAAVGGRNRTLTSRAISTFGLDPWVRERTVPLPDVQVVDVAGWMKRHFTQSDFVLAKVDIEGVEFELFAALAKLGALSLLDGVTYECHKVSGQSCLKLSELLHKHAVPIINLCALHASPGQPCKSRDDDANFWRERRVHWRKDIRGPACSRFNVTLTEQPWASGSGRRRDETRQHETELLYGLSDV